jgi:hypothetical protein
MRARVAELVDALDLGSSSGDRMGVQVSPLAPCCWRDVFSFSLVMPHLACTAGSASGHNEQH